MKLALIAFILLTLPGCIFYSRWQESANNAELIKQEALLLEAKRNCLANTASDPVKQRDCSVYNQSRTQLDVTGIK